MHAKDPYEANYQLLITERESTGLKHFNDCKLCIEYLYDVQDAYKNIDKKKADKERKILLVFDDIFADMINNKKVKLIVAELFISGRKLNISLLRNHILRFQKMLD